MFVLIKGLKKQCCISRRCNKLEIDRELMLISLLVGVLIIMRFYTVTECKESQAPAKVTTTNNQSVIAKSSELVHVCFNWHRIQH